MPDAQLTFPLWLIVSGDDLAIEMVDQAECFLGYSSKEVADRYVEQTGDKRLGTRAVDLPELETLASDHPTIALLAWNWLPSSQNVICFSLNDFHRHLRLKDQRTHRSPFVSVDCTQST